MAEEGAEFLRMGGAAHSGEIPARSQTVTFDPFGDFATEGHLRNFEKEKVLAIVKRAENASFTTGLDEAFASLAKALPGFESRDYP
jgi:hypothetical protein